MGTVLLSRSTGTLRDGFGVVLEAATRAARGFLRPSHTINEKAREIAVEGKNVYCLQASNDVIVSCLVKDHCFGALGFISCS